jgi:hypothetical protein
MFRTRTKGTIMKNALRILFIVVLGFVLTMGTACNKPLKKTGFLSDYSDLEPDDGSLRYVNMKRLGSYDRFILEPVVVKLYGTPVGARPAPETSRELANYMHNAIVNAIRDRYIIVSQPGPGIAKIRVALTDIEKSTPALNILPQTKISGIGIGGASMEAEVIDSRTGEQIGAVIQNQKGKRISMSGLKKWGDAKSVMDDWVERFRKRLDEAHGY